MQSFEVKIRVEGIEERLEFSLKFTEDTPDQSIIIALRSKVKAERRDTITLESLSGALIPISTKSIMPEKECRLIVERRKKRAKNPTPENERGQSRKRKSTDAHESGTEPAIKKRAEDNLPTTEKESKLAINYNSYKYFMDLQKHVQLRDHSADSIEELFKLNIFPKFPTNVAFERESSAYEYAVFDFAKGYNDLDFVSSALINSKYSFNSISMTENGNRRFYDDLIVNPIYWYSKKVDSEDGFKLEISRNSSKPPSVRKRSIFSLSNTTSTTTTDKGYEHRPDASLWCCNICFMKCEEKADERDFERCKAQLESNMGILSSKFYGAVPCLFCIAIANYKVTIYRWDRWDRLGNNIKLHALRTFDLRESGQRLALIACSLVIARLVHIFYREKLFSRECPLPLNVLNSRPNNIKVGIMIEGTQAKSDYFYKEMLVTEKPTFHSVEHIKQMYEFLKAGKIPNTTRVIDFTINGNMLEIKTWPVCLESMPYIVIKESLCLKSLRKALVAVVEALNVMHRLGLVHRDVRWPNVMFNPETERFVLIDFEHSGPKNQFVNSAVRNYPPAIVTKKKPYTCATDMFMVGKLIQELAYLDGFPQVMRDLMNDLLVEDDDERPAPSTVIRSLNMMNI